MLLIIAALRKTEPGPPARWAAVAGALTATLVPMIVSIWKPLYNPRFTVVAAPFQVGGTSALPASIQ